MLHAGLEKDGFLDLANGRYKIRPALLENTTIEDLSQLTDELLGSLRSAYEQRQTAIRRLEENPLIAFG